MEVTEAVLAAKNYVLEIFGEEGIVETEVNRRNSKKSNQRDEHG